MKKTVKKLQSDRGATMILAMVFMLICVFVGGSVLTAASVNGGRLANARSDQQDLLNQRSIAAVIASELSDHGVISLSFPLGVDAMSRPTVIPPEGEMSAVQRAVFNAVRDAYASAEGKGSAKMTFTFQDNSEAGANVSIACTVRAERLNERYIKANICFDDEENAKRHAAVYGGHPPGRLQLRGATLPAGGRAFRTRGAYGYARAGDPAAAAEL